MRSRAVRLVAVGLVVLSYVAVAAPTRAEALSGTDPALCKSTSERISVPSGYPLAICFDGSTVTIKNTTTFVLQIKQSGDTGLPRRLSSFPDPAAEVIAHTDPSPDALPPGYSVAIPVGSGASTLTLAGSGDNSKFARLRYLSSLIPGNVYADYSAMNDFASALGSASDSYAQCASGANFFRLAACNAELSWAVSQALASFGTKVGVQFLKHAAILGQILNLISTARWADASVHQLLTLLQSPKAVAIAATQPTAPSCSATSIQSSTGSTIVGTVECAGGWALAGVAGTEGQTLFQTTDGRTWKVLRSLGDAFSLCVLTAAGVSTADATSMLTQLGSPSWRLSCPSATTSPPAASQPSPTLGTSAWAAALPDGGIAVAGFGEAAPATINEGGNDPTAGYVDSITWSNWGAAQATGQGMAIYVSDPNASVSSQPVVPVTVVAFNLGSCGGGAPAYQSVAWYFPEYGQAFDPATAFNACTGALG